MQLNHRWAERLSLEVVAQLTRYAEDLVRFNPVENLVSRVDPEREIRRLIEESVRAGEELGLGSGDRVLDVGSGGGFPGLVWACLHPRTDFVLAERRRARCDFLEREVRRLRLERVTIFAGDVRSLDAGTFTFVSAKAVADADEYLAWVEPHLGGSARVVVFQRAGWPGPGREGWKIERSWSVLEEADRADRWVYVVGRGTPRTNVPRETMSRDDQPGAG